MASINELEKDFEVFEKGVSRLEDLRKELNSLNTKGYEKDKKKIESELKNVTDIPKIERQMSTLKRKINGIYKPKKKYVKKKIKPVKSKVVKKKVVPKVNLDKDVAELVKAQMNSVAFDIKKSLSDRVKLKETKLQEKIKEKEVRLLEDINKKEEELKKSYAKKYEDRVNTELKNRVQKEFNEKLSKQYNSKKEKLLVQLDQKLRDKEELLEKKNNFELKKYKSEDSGDGSGNSKLKIASIGGLIVVGAIVLVFLMGFLIQNWIIPAIIGGIIISAWWFRNMKYRDKARFGKFMIRVVIAIALVYVLYLLLWNTGVYESNIQPIINKIKDTTGATFSNIFSIFTNPEEQRGFGEFEDEELKKEGIGVEIKNFGADNRFNANHPIIVKGDLIVANLGEKESSANFNCEMEGYGSVNSLADEVKPETMIIPGYPEKSSEKITCIFEEGLNPEKKLDTREIKLIASFDEFYSTTDYELYFIHPSTYYELDRDGDGSPDDNPFKTYGWSMDHVNRITNVVGSVSSPGPVQVRVGTETPQPLKTDSEDLYFEVIVKSNEKANLKKVNELKIYIPSESIYIDEAESLFCEFEFLESSGKYNVYVPKESVYERLNEECVTKSCYQDKEKIIFGCYFSVNDFLDYGTQQDEIKVEMDYAFELISESSVTVRQSSD